MKYAALAAPLLLLGACATPPAPADCHLSAGDAAWRERAIEAWRWARANLLAAQAPSGVEAVVFDSACVTRSETALGAEPIQWHAARIEGGEVQVGREAMPVGVVSGAMADESGMRFVMSTPTVWAAGGVTPGPLGLDRLMTAVLLHEATHVLQMPSYGEEIAALQAAQKLPDAEFNDDAIQARFGEEAEFAASVERETALFFAAAEAGSPDETRRLAREARALMQARAARWFVGEQAYQTRAEDLWLTLEGSGQWAGYRWLTRDGGVAVEAATAGFGKRGTSWTQLEGLAIVLTLERLGVPEWKQRLFGDGRATVLELLDAGLE